jgi:hypothetical protein
MGCRGRFSDNGKVPHPFVSNLLGNGIELNSQLAIPAEERSLTKICFVRNKNQIHMMNLQKDLIYL